MSDQPQLGFSFDGVATQRFDEEVSELLATSEEEGDQLCPDCYGKADICNNVNCARYQSPLELPEQTFLLPEVEEDFKLKQNQPEDEIPWGDYVRMVQLFFNSENHSEFKELASKLAVLFNTKNVTDTVMEAMRCATNRSKI